jgi:MFS transporter, PAT family, beta-lactamase induction signal transducer AmpG
MNPTLKKIFSYRMLCLLLLGYAAGLPLLLTGGTLQAWMSDEGVDLGTIGMVSLIGLPYTIKFLWSPFLDRFKLPFFSRRKGWMIFCQAFLMLTIFSLSFVNPKSDLMAVGLTALLIAFFSASQDIAIDAYRREILPDEELGLGSSVYVTGYRLGMLLAGAGALILADQIPWPTVYKWMGLFMAPAILFSIIAPKERTDIKAPSNMREAIVGPLKEFFTRPGALLIILFILLFKVGDLMAANLITPFILEAGYTKTDLGTVAKGVGMIATIIGGLTGGVIMLRLPMRPALVIFGILQAISTLGFALLAMLPTAWVNLALVIGFENLAAGMGMAAYGGFMASLTDKRFTATQYALLSSVMGITRVILPAPTGYIADAVGWEVFFLICTLAAIPGLLLLIPVFRLERQPEKALTA